MLDSDSLDVTVFQWMGGWGGGGGTIQEPP